MRSAFGDTASWALAMEQRIPARQNPPMVFACVADDGGKPRVIRCIYDSLQSAGVLGELHIYAPGGHDFALRYRINPAKFGHSIARLRSREFLSRN